MKQTLPQAAPGEAAEPLAMTVAALRSFGSICGKSSSSKRSGFTLQMASSFFFREDAFLDEVVGDHGFRLSRTLAIADREEVQRRDAIDLFDRELGILHVAAFVFELLASGFELFINGMESLVFVIAKGFERQGVADIVVLFMVGRAISPAAQYARPSALCPAGIRAFAPGYALDRYAVCAHTPGRINLSTTSIIF